MYRQLVLAKLFTSAAALPRAARYFKSNPEFWLHLQTFYELELTSGIVSDIGRHVHPAAQLVS
jgi:plasmid maintenance system antidote protein VapI